MKNMIKKIVLRFWPELQSGTHLPQMAIVTEIPDPPKNGEKHSHERPLYAVNCKLLQKNGEIDEIMPALRDIPVAMTGSANNRGFAALPKEGTIVEIAFAFGCQSKPFIRSILPFYQNLPAIDKETMRWQQNDESFQEINKDGNWQRKTSGSISDQAQNISSTGTEENTITAPKIWMGNEDDNALKIDSDCMNAIITALDTLANHTHPTVGQIAEGGAVSTQKQIIQALKTKLDSFVKT